MPLDSGSVTETYASVASNEETVSLQEASSLGAGLRAARAVSGRSLQDFSEITRVRTEYLDALERDAWDRLPSRPFAIGYVRAYARALGVDEETAAERFKAEHPDSSVPLQAPVGAELDDVKPRSRGPMLAALAVLCAVVGWNVAQRAMQSEQARVTALAEQADVWAPGVPPGATAAGFIAIGAPRPAPADQTVPAPYVTPGLESQLIAADAEDAAAARAAAADLGAAPVRRAFNPRGAVYGEQPHLSSVILQARKPAHLIVRSADGATVYFARQLAAGEAYRVPRTAAAVADVSDPAAFDKFMNGEHRGVLDAPLVQLSALNAEADRLAQAAAAEAARERAQFQALTGAAAAPAPAAAAVESPVRPQIDG